MLLSSVNGVNRPVIVTSNNQRIEYSPNRQISSKKTTNNTVPIAFGNWRKKLLNQFKITSKDREMLKGVFKETGNAIKDLFKMAMRKSPKQ